MRAVIVCLMLAAFFVTLTSESSNARPEYWKVYLKQYVKGKRDEAWQKMMNKNKCYVCHQGKKKKNRNIYGEALAKFLNKKTKKDNEKTLKALLTVAKQLSDPKDKKSPTFGTLIERGEFPAGKLEDLKKEPPKKGDDKKEGSDEKD